MTAREVIALLEQRAPATAPDDGFRFGAPDAEVKGVLVCWMTTLAALERAITEDCNLVICHETLFYPQSSSIDEERCWRTNRRRMEMMHQGGLTVYRGHAMLDRLCIFDDFAAALGLTEVCAGEGFARVFRIPPTPLGSLVERAKQATRLPAVRVVGDLERKVTRVALPWGGMGLYANISFMQRLVENGAEVGICGETDEYAMHFAEDAGLALIETSHVASETIGLRRVAGMLAQDFPARKVVFYESVPAWRMV